MLPTISASDIKGVVGFMITPVLDQEITAKSNDVINLEEAARAADALVRDGVSGICLNGTFGELPSLTWSELQAFTQAVVDSVNHRVPVFAGATTLNTRDSITRGRRFREIGADGLLLGRPMMSALGDEAIVDFYRNVAAEIPDMAIFLYDDAEAFKRPINTQVYGELSKIPQIVAAKYRTRLLVGSLAPNTYEDNALAAKNFPLLVHEGDWAFAYREFGVPACWSSSVSAGPAPVIALQEALESGDKEAADAIRDDIRWAMDGLVPEAGFEAWHVHKIPTLKARFVAAGYIAAGPPLPPYQFLPEERRLAAERCGERWAELQGKYSQSAVPAGS